LDLNLPVDQLRRNSEECGHAQVRANAIAAFQGAATFCRPLDTEQYSVSGLNFMTDALFFSAYTSEERGSQQVGGHEYELFADVYGDNYQVGLQNDMGGIGSKSTLFRHGPQHENGVLTWHMARLTNPDYIRHISFKVNIQRPDCFQVFPSEGFLRPGETSHVYFCVRSLGALVNVGMDEIDVFREEVDVFSSKVYKTEGMLPWTPFLVRYIMCPAPPYLPRGYNARKSRGLNVVDYMWANIPPNEIRTIHIAGHVNTAYGYDEFQQATLMPFDLHADGICTDNLFYSTFLSPNLEMKDKSLRNRVRWVDFDLRENHPGIVHQTEKECVDCGRGWNAYCEELGRVYCLEKMACDVFSTLYKEELHFNSKYLELLMNKFDDIERKKNHLMTKAIGDEMRMHDIQMQTYEAYASFQCKCIEFHSILMKRRANRNVTKYEKNTIRAYEETLIELYRMAQENSVSFAATVGNEHLMKEMDMFHPWIYDGVYQYSRSSEGAISCLDEEKYKREPDYLARFRLFQHSPGFWSLIQGNLNELNSGMHSDLPMGSNWEALKSALSLLHDPKGLIANGIFVHYVDAGLVRRPITRNTSALYAPSRSIPSISGKLVDEAKYTINRWYLSQRKFGDMPSLSDETAPFSVMITPMNDIDKEGHALVCFVDSQGLYPMQFPSSSMNYLCGVSSPGIGRFSVSALDHSTNSIISFYDQQLDSNNERYMPFSEYDTDGPENMPAVGIMPRIDRHQVQVRNGLRRRTNFLWILAAYFGWSVDDTNVPVVDRRILVAAQWMSNVFLIMPTLLSLMMRWFMVIPNTPIERHLEMLIYLAPRQREACMSTGRCGAGVIFLIICFFVLGRHSERKIAARSYERDLEERAIFSVKGTGLSSKWCTLLARIWDFACPASLQQLTFIPSWNRTPIALRKRRIAIERNKEANKYFSMLFDVKRGFRNRLFPKKFLDNFGETWSKWLVGGTTFVFTFNSSTPHFWLNLLSIFYAGVACGISLSINTIETGRGCNASNLLEFVHERNIFSIISVLSLAGQIVGGSGGLLFLAEVLGTAVLILVGGGIAATSTGTADSWFRFLVFSLVGFWGYITARVGIVDGIRRHCLTWPSRCLIFSIIVAAVSWIIIMSFSDLTAIAPTIIVIQNRSGNGLLQ